MKRFFLLFISLLSSILAEPLFLNGNVAQFSLQASHIIPFIMTRRLSDGALKSELLQELQSVFDLQTFVESGTYLGNTVAQAEPIFKKIYSIELSPQLARQAKYKFRKQKKITILCGDSGEILHSLLPTLDTKILFYLDGHYSGGTTAQGSLNTPVMEELAAICDCHISDGIILIDDIRGFQDSLYPEKIVNTALEGYPDLRQVSEALLKINPKYQICFLGDALLAFPENPKVSVSQVVAACALHHFTAINLDLSEGALRHADKAIMAAQGYEKEQLIEYFKAYSDFELTFGFRCFGALWYGLLLYGEGHTEEAQTIFKKASDCSPPGWRIHQLQQYL